jgi:hypothetical protein
MEIGCGAKPSLVRHVTAFPMLSAQALCSSQLGNYNAFRGYYYNLRFN